MTAFSTPVLDDFNRADGALGSNWGRYAPTSGVATVVSNRARSSNSGAFPFTGNYWVPDTYLNTEVYATLTSWPLAGANGTMYHLWARGQNMDTANAVCYVMEILMGDVPSQLRLGQANNTGIRQSTWTSDYQTCNAEPWMNSFAMGDKMGFRCYDWTGPGLPGVMLEGWTYMAADPYWRRRFAYLDKTMIISSAGSIGFSEAIGIGGQTCSLDDFGGGTALPTPYSMSDMSVLTGALPDPVGELVLPNSRQGLVQTHPQAMQDPIAASVRDHLGMGADPSNHPELIGGQVKIR